MALAAWLLVLLPPSPAAVAQSPVPGAQTKSTQEQTQQLPHVPPRVREAERFLAQRGWTPGHRLALRTTAARNGILASPAVSQPQSTTSSSTNATWTALGPTAVQTPSFDLVTGRVATIALDPSDTTGNRLFIGTTGGGVWFANNAGVANTSLIAFTPLTDAVTALGGAVDPSISIGALTVQSGGTDVILAGTGDPNDVLDSYYGAGILRSTNGGNTWSLIQQTMDEEDGLSTRDFSFVGEGFAGFAWSTVNPQLVVAAVSQAYEGTLVDAVRTNLSDLGLYYSSDSGTTWHLATVTDSNGEEVQGPLSPQQSPGGNAATAVVWNPVRQLFVAAMRYHGYYQSSDGVNWTRMTVQPGSTTAVPNLSITYCPTYTGSIGSISCPIFRGALAVNPQTGDTFAWTVDLNNQNQGLWQDQCAISGGACGNPTITFGKQWSTAALETSTLEGAATIADGDRSAAAGQRHNDHQFGVGREGVSGGHADGPDDVARVHLDFIHAGSGNVSSRGGAALCYADKVDPQVSYQVRLIAPGLHRGQADAGDHERVSYGVLHMTCLSVSLWVCTAQARLWTECAVSIPPVQRPLRNEASPKIRCPASTQKRSLPRVCPTPCPILRKLSHGGTG